MFSLNIAKAGQIVQKFKGEETHAQQDDTRRLLFNFQKRTWTTNYVLSSTRIWASLEVAMSHSLETLTK